MNPLVLGAIGVAALLLFLGRGGQAQGALPDGQTSGNVGTPGLGGAGDVTVIPPGAGGSSQQSESFSGSSGSSTQDSIVSTYTAEPTVTSNSITEYGPGYTGPSSSSSSSTPVTVQLYNPAASPAATTTINRGGPVAT